MNYKEAMQSLDDFVVAHGTGVKRRGEKGKKEYTVLNHNVSERLCFFN